MEKALNRKTYFWLMIVISTITISYLHYSTMPNIHDLHNIFTELYYLPLLLSALVFGLKGGVITFTMVIIMYAPFVYINWTGNYAFIANKLLHAIVSGSIVLIAGSLVERERKIREKAEKEHYLVSLGYAAASIVHDLRTPLIVIEGFAKRMFENKGDIKSSYETVKDSTGKMNAIINDVLDFAKPVKLVRAEADLRDVIKKACECCALKAAEKEVDLSVELPSEPHTASLDRAKLERAIINFLNNAIDASLVGQTISVSLVKQHAKITIKITDRGQGMDKETLANIFIPFYTKKSTGTGLGLAIAKKIVEGHEGKVSVNSQENEGTEIIIVLSDNSINKLS